MRNDTFMPVERIEQAIYLLRGQKVMLDRDLAVLYGVETKRLTELAEVLDYPRIACALEQRRLSPRDILEAVVSVSEFVTPAPLTTRLVPGDPDDDHVLACAMAAHADVIVTGDRHLLKLGQWKTICILTPMAYLEQFDQR